MIQSKTETADFQRTFTSVFDSEFPRLFRYLDRLSGDPDLAADLAQEAFVRLLQRGSLPEEPRAWLVTVSLNLFRNHTKTRRRRRLLLTEARTDRSRSDAPPPPSALVEGGERRRRVRAALDRLSERDRQLLVLSTLGYEYGEIATILDLKRTSVGKLLQRARDSFKREVCRGG